MDKTKIMNLLNKDWQKYWKVNLFEELGYKRYTCPFCSKHYWSLEERASCGDPPCGEYEFIGKPFSPKKMDYIQTWKAIEKFFQEKDHVSLPSYPVVCRWFPGLNFTVASIVDFQRSSGGKTVFEFPEKKIIIPQACLRFNDIPNVGVSGRHQTAFTMVGQHTREYWKDEALALDNELLTNVFKVPQKDIVYHEDIWAGHNAFGYSLEYYVGGLEVGNCVFTEFLGDSEHYEVMPDKLIDMGAGLERFCWMTQGTPTIYDAVYGPLIDKLKSQVDYDHEFFLEYSKLSGRINADERDFTKSQEFVAKHFGISIKELEEKIAPLQGVYAVADHAKALAFWIADGALPSNVGGGYNLRVLFRRASNLIDKYSLTPLNEIALQHAEYLEPIFPNLKENSDLIQEILAVEKRKYSNSKERAQKIISSLKGKKVNEEKLIELYDSNGVPPELVVDEVPKDFYLKVTERHVEEKIEVKEEELELSFPSTQKLFYGPSLEFSAKVLGNVNWKKKNWVVLDQTAFYAESGGQSHDTGFLNNEEVHDVQVVRGVILHQVNKELSGEVNGKVDSARRKQLTQHHTSTHMINGAAQKVLGKHVWQAGAYKSLEKAHLDITHYDSLSEEQEKRIEELANQCIKENITVVKKVLPRVEAEKEFGFRLYQGGAVPSKELRVLSIPGWDTEACGGTHLDKTSEAEKIIILSTEKISDSIVRITFCAGNAAKNYEEQISSLVSSSAELLGVTPEQLPGAAKNLLFDWKQARKELEKKSVEKVKELVSSLEFTKFKDLEVLITKVKGSMNTLRLISQELFSDNRFIFLVGESDKTYLFCSAGKKFVEHKVNAGKLVREVTEGKGGGPAFKGEGVLDTKNVDVLLDSASDKLAEAFK